MLMIRRKLTSIVKHKTLPSEIMLINKTKASESSLLAKVSNDLVAMTAPVLWLSTATFTPLLCSSNASNTLETVIKLLYLQRGTKLLRVLCNSCSFFYDPQKIIWSNNIIWHTNISFYNYVESCYCHYLKQLFHSEKKG